MKRIPKRYFEELLISGHTVPRYESNGGVIPFRVGSEYILKNEELNKEINVRCTQDCPTHLILIE